MLSGAGLNSRRFFTGILNALRLPLHTLGFPSIRGLATGLRSHRFRPPMLGEMTSPSEPVGVRVSGATKIPETMNGKRHTTEEKIRALREADGGRAIRELCQERNISEATYHRWRKQLGLIKVDPVSSSVRTIQISR